MIKLKNLLIENRSTPINIQSAIKYIKNIGIPIDKIFDKSIYRGNSRISDDFYYMNPASFDRRSAHTSNYYTLAIDNFPEWKEYPKRSKSIICTTDTDKASEYGNTYRVIPLSKNTKIGICPKNDIWDSFKMNLNDLNEIIKMGFMCACLYLNKHFSPESETKFYELELLDKIINKNNYTYNDLIQAFEIVDKYKEKIWDNWVFNMGEIINYIFNQNKNCLESYEKFLDPINNKFSVVSFDNYSLSYIDREVWLDSECLLVDEDIADDFLNECKRTIEHD